MSEKPGNGRGRGRGLRRDKSMTRPGGASAEVGSSGSGVSTATDATTASMAALTIVSMAGSTVVGSSATTETRSSSPLSNFSDTLPKRPDFGTKGRPIKLRSNNFVVNIINRNGPVEVYQYRVEISNDFRKSKREDCFAIFYEICERQKLITEQYTVLYDGGNICFSIKPLHFPNDNREFRGSFDIDLPRYTRPSKYGIVMTPTGRTRIDFADEKLKHTSLTILDLAFRQLFNMPDKDKAFHPFGRSFFFAPKPGDGTGFDLDAGRQVWGGYFFGAKLGFEMAPVVNIDVANSVFIKKQTVLQFMCDVLNQWANRMNYNVDQLAQMQKPYYLQPNEVQAFVKAIKGFCVLNMRTPDRPQKVFNVTSQAAEAMMFEWRETKDSVRKLSVADYYAQRYKKPLRFPFFPCLEVGSKSKVSYLPLEICEMYEPQRVTGKLSEVQTSMMIKGVCTDAVERENRIRGMIKRAKLDQDPFGRRFGFKIDLKMMEVQGRVIPAPSLEYFNGFKVMPREGSWQMAPQKLYAAAAIPVYCVVSFIEKRSENDLVTFCQMLMDTALKMGMRVDSQMPMCVRYVNTVDHLKEAMDSCIQECGTKGKKCDFILVPMHAKNTEIYAAVKCIAEKDVGIITQCVIQRNIRQPKQQTCQNIVLKMNAKLGGVNCKLFADEVSRKYLIDQPTLVMGIDVTHPAPTDRKAPSIGAAVANIDMLPGKFGASINVQKHRREAVVYLTDAIQKRVDAFYRQTQRKPERIIVYRDGVAEGQFREVLTEEVKNIRSACEVIGGKEFKPKITFIVVQKRHHTRFFCCNSGDMCGRGKNVPPGTVVDSIVTHPSQFDFFLCSHYGIQGTSRPAHYHVLLDENQFTQDELQAITYSMCHLYFRCNRSVSIPAPTYYAHLACARARHHLHTAIGDANSDTFSDAGSGSSTSSQSSEEEIRKAVQVVDSLITKMYFC